MKGKKVKTVKERMETRKVEGIKWSREREKKKKEGKMKNERKSITKKSNKK